MTATAEITHSPWCPQIPHVEDDAIHFYTAVEALYRQRTGRHTMPTVAVCQAAGLLLTVLDDAADAAEAQDAGYHEARRYAVERAHE